MGAFLVYILKSASCLAIFYLFYRLLLSKETFCRFNRFALLFLLMLSVLLPLVQYNGTQNEVIEQVVTVTEGRTDDIISVEGRNTIVLSWAHYILLLYITGVVFFYFRSLYSTTKLLLLLRKGKREPIGNYLKDKAEITLIIMKDDIAPFSWMNYIVLSTKDLQENSQEILLHECAHICHHHSLDLLFIELFIPLQWFNPAAWLFKQELQTIHEYEADQKVLQTGIDIKKYQLLLIKKAVGARLYSLANSLNHSNLNKRITMMMKKKSNPWARLKYAYVLPLAAIAVTALARPEVQEVSNEISAAKVNDLVGNVLTNADENLSSSESFESLPEYPGGTDALMRYMAQSFRYPAEAIQQNIQGRVLLSVTIDEEGNVTYPTVINSNANALLSKEAQRVAHSMQKWQPAMKNGKPVKFSYVFPINFKLVDANGADITGASIDASPIQLLSTLTNSSSTIEVKQMDEIYVVGYGSK